jgi:hypothetical protein
MTTYHGDGRVVYLHELVREYRAERVIYQRIDDPPCVRVKLMGCDRDPRSHLQAHPQDRWWKPKEVQFVDIPPHVHLDDTQYIADQVSARLDVANGVLT